MVFISPGLHHAAAAYRAVRVTRRPNHLIPLESKIMSNVVKTTGEAILGGDQILTIAHADAARVYRDLSLYRIQLVLEDDGWHVDYELKSPTLKGGGPHYLIDPHSGAIIRKRYEQ
jgi:hypothetical protein